MNVKYRLFLMGIMLLIIQPVAMANLYFYPYTQQYSNCEIKLNDDNSVEVSFRAIIVKDLYSPSGTTINGKYMLAWGRLLGIPPDEMKNIGLPNRRALLSLYFYKADGSRDFNIQFKDIANLSLNGVTPSGSNDNTQEIEFNRDHKSSPFDKRYYYVSFKVPAHALKDIRIGATVGGVLHYKGQYHSLMSSNGVSFGQNGKQCTLFNPQADVAPEALKIDPKFRMDAKTWQLKSFDLDELLEKIERSTKGKSVHAPLINPAGNRFCIRYRTTGIQQTRYMISATNRNGLAANTAHFQLKEAVSDKTIGYTVEFQNLEGNTANFVLPKEKKFIQLRNDNDGEMCWAPRIRLYNTRTTDKGSYSDTLNFTITPQA
ncbi:hypothetical protein [Yersinia intermedia]|uniref:hypothetical protein n=1 Tax=Yersinia intermedia TaxID=631 RepID=UPI0015C67CC7|nr:hypothetical protein [Yersinia intermedia]